MTIKIITPSIIMISIIIIITIINMPAEHEKGL